jgi:GH25 family lysozyme M1 (1,4-beta-N-acetylmuramidase)
MTTTSSRLRATAALSLPLVLALALANPAHADTKPTPSPAAAVSTPAATKPAPAPSGTAAVPTAPASAPASTAPAPAPATTAAAPAAAAEAAAASAPATTAAAPAQGEARMGRAGLNPASGSAAQAVTEQLNATQATEPSVSEQPFATRGQPLGLDVSNWQGTVNWPSIKANGARFAYIKATEGTGYRSASFGAQYSGAASVGLLRGAYHFGRPDGASGASQASYFVNNGGGWSADGITMPPVLDIEDNPYAGLNRCYGKTPGQLATWVRDFTQTVYRLTNKQAMIYTSYYFWRDCLGNTSEFSQTNPLWLASYYTNSPLIPGGWPTYTAWQYANDYANASQTVKATFPGDQNVFNGSMDQLRRLASTPDKYEIGAPAGSTPISGKWHGDGKSYLGWMLNGYGCVQNPTGGPSCFAFGAPGDKPVTGDWNGDGRTTIGIVRAGRWYLSNNLTNGSIDSIAAFGEPGDTPVTGDWTGSGRTGIGIFRNGTWALGSGSSGGVAVTLAVNFGQGGDSPVTGDWDANGRTTIGIFRNNLFALNNTTSSSQVATAFIFGDPGDVPLAGDWNGNGSSTVGIRRGLGHYLTNSLANRSVDAMYF